MPVPLIWVGAGLAALYAGAKIAESHRDSGLVVKHYPGESDNAVTPINGAVVCCGIFGVFDHTGIWLDGSIIELKGNGLIRGISPERFIHNRSGEQIYVACGKDDQPLIDPTTAARAAERLYQYSEYHVIENNCHRFVWNCVSGRNEKLTRFSELNDVLSRYFDTRVSWHSIS